MLSAGIAARPGSCLLSAAAGMQQAKQLNTQALTTTLSAKLALTSSRGAHCGDLCMRRVRQQSLLRVQHRGVNHGSIPAASSRPSPPRNSNWSGRHRQQYGSGFSDVSPGSSSSSSSGRRRRGTQHSVAPSLSSVSLSANNAAGGGEAVHRGASISTAAAAAAAATAGATAAGGRPAQVAEGGIVYFVSTPIGNLEDMTLR